MGMIFQIRSGDDAFFT
ncbi:hypothetical protein ABHC48_03825 [Ruminococcus sp. 1001136sp1]